MRKLALLLIMGGMSCMASAEANHWEDKKIMETEAAAIVESMTLEEKLGQILMLDFRSWQGRPVIAINDDITRIIHDYHIGSVILFRDNLINTAQTIHLIDGLQNASSGLPLFIATDQEGGYVTRLREGTEMPGNMALGATRDPSAAKLAGEIHASELSALGFNFNFSPVVDVNNNQNNPIIGVRSYSDRPTLVIEMANAYLDGSQEHQIANSLKHFPGHGNVHTDTHVALPSIDISQSEWENVELKPFLALKDKADAIMTAHIVVPALDNRQLKALDGSQIGTPATLSKPILTDLLRNKLGFQGLIITDAMDMGAITHNFDRTWAIKAAILAGNDIILMPMSIENKTDLAAFNDIYIQLKEEAAQDGELMSRIDVAAAHVIAMKLEKGISKAAKDVAFAKGAVASSAHKRIEDQISAQAITLIKNDYILPFDLENDHVLPFDLENNQNIMVISDEAPRNALAQQIIEQIAADNGRKIHVHSKVIKLMRNDFDIASLKAQFSEQNLIILMSYSLTKKDTNAQKVVDLANELSVPLVLVSSRNPYDIAYLDDIKANLAIYGITGFDVTNNVRNSLETNIRSGIKTIFSINNKPLNNPTGKLPVDIKSADGSTIVAPYGSGLSYKLGGKLFF